MVTTVTLYLAFLAVMGVQRLYELRLSRQNAAWSFARGGVEVGRDHFRWMKLLHTAFLVGCALEVVVLHRPFIPIVALPMVGWAIAAQALRLWVITTLGPQWNVRVIVVPGASAVVTGPFRFLRHPNYLAVVIEGVAVPLMHGAYVTAVLFTVFNLLLLRVRIGCEEEALGRLHGYDQLTAARGA